MYIVLTAAKPDESLIDTVKALSEDGRKIVVCTGVSEGDHIPDIPGAVFINAPIGRGAALKAGLSEVLRMASKDECVLTLESPALSLTRYIDAVVSEWETHTDCIAVGSFNRKASLSFRQRIAVRLTRGFMGISTGIKLSDPFSGLRAFSAGLIPDLLDIKGDGFDYESRCLVYASKHGIHVHDVPCSAESTPSLPDGFSTFRAAGPIFRVLMAFILSSLSSFVIDYAAFLLFSFLFGLIPTVYQTAEARSVLPLFGAEFDIHIIALVLARCISSFCNFTFNHRLVFKAGGRGAIIRYYLLLIVMLLLNSGLFTLITGEGGLPAWLAQPAVQIILYPLNFIAQRKWVFPNNKQ